MEFGELSFVLWQVVGYVFRFALTLAIVSWPLFVLAKVFNPKL